MHKAQPRNPSRCSVCLSRTEVNAHLASPPFSFLELKLPNVHRVFDSSKLLGPIHMMAMFGTKRFADANPKLIDAVIAALDEANDLVARDKPKAAAINAKASAVKVSEAEVLDMISTTDMAFSSTPRGFMQFVEFMHKSGSIKVRPSDWKEMFVPAMHGRPGS